MRPRRPSGALTASCRPRPAPSRGARAAGRGGSTRGSPPTRAGAAGRRRRRRRHGKGQRRRPARRPPAGEGPDGAAPPRPSHLPPGRGAGTLAPPYRPRPRVGRGRGRRAPAQTRTPGCAQVAGGRAALAAAERSLPGLARCRRGGRRQPATQRVVGGRFGAAAVSHVKGCSRPGQRRGRPRSPTALQRGGFPSASAPGARAQPFACPVKASLPRSRPSPLGGGCCRGVVPVNAARGWAWGVAAAASRPRASQPHRQWMRPGGAAEPAQPLQPAEGTRGAAMT